LWRYPSSVGGRFILVRLQNKKVGINLKGIFTYTGIRVKDLEKSVKFYTQVLGMKETGRGDIEATGGQVVSLVSEDGGPQLELNYYGKGSKFATEYVVGEGIDHLAFKVDDLDKALNEAKKLGHPTSLEIKSGTSKWAYIEDPNGILIELFA
jgi:lactoylglutathione lyase